MAKVCSANNAKPIAIVNNQSNSVVNTLLPHEIQPKIVLNMSSINVWKGKSVGQHAFSIPFILHCLNIVWMLCDKMYECWFLLHQWKLFESLNQSGTRYDGS